MRKHWLTTWTMMVAAAGCAVPGIPGAPYRMAQQPESSSQMAAKQASTPQGASWTQKLKSMIPAAPQLSSNKAEDLQKTDPISLGFSSAPPTPELYLSMAEMSDRGGNAEHARSMYQKTLSLQP